MGAPRAGRAVSAPEYAARQRELDDPLAAAEYRIGTPRSLEACRACGVRPADLTKRSLRSFLRDGPPELAGPRYDRHVARREALLHDVVAERAALIAAGAFDPPAAPAPAPLGRSPTKPPPDEPSPSARRGATLAAAAAQQRAGIAAVLTEHRALAATRGDHRRAAAEERRLAAQDEALMRHMDAEDAHAMVVAARREELAAIEATHRTEAAHRLRAKDSRRAATPPARKGTWRPPQPTATRLHRREECRAVQASLAARDARATELRAEEARQRRWTRAAAVSSRAAEDAAQKLRSAHDRRLDIDAVAAATVGQQVALSDARADRAAAVCGAAAEERRHAMSEAAAQHTLRAAHAAATSAFLDERRAEVAEEAARRRQHSAAATLEQQRVDRLLRMDRAAAAEEAKADRARRARRILDYRAGITE